MYFKKIIGERCYLSPISVEDIERWTTWENDLEVAVPLGSEAHTVMPIMRMQQIVNDMSQNQSQAFTVLTLEDNEPIGRTMLFNINMIDRSAMFGILIGEKHYWGRGFGQEATRLTLDFAFNLLNLNSVMLGFFEFNERARHAYERVGFKVIGRRRQARIIAGQAFDVILMDILAEEFESPHVRRVLDSV